MQQDNSSFWADVKALEEQLADNPDSYCFAKLAEVYLKVGLLDDALHTVRKGVEKYPRYLAGQRALALACHAKGLSGESLAALKLVTEVEPEDLASQKMLGRLSIELGDSETAARAFRTALEFAPEDVECRLELDSLVRSEGAFDGTASVEDEDDEEILDDLEIIEDIEVFEEDDEEQQGYEFGELPSPESVLTGSSSDPLSTGTLAELYVSQGFIHKALEIYRNLLVDDPANSAISARITELEMLETTPTETSADEDDFYSEEIEGEPETLQSLPGLDSHDPQADLLVPEPVVSDATVAAVTAGTVGAVVATVVVDKAVPFIDGDFHYESFGNTGVSLPPSSGSADNAVSILEGWLENIRRIRS